ncbi:hypothetical protein HNY73_017735 [Argiope bruennichi]|uniref:Secreted protein n=1 Tax=Argiope bruennichi TaxID=94029 RepID=A0A8T0EBK5_ARGBR|nr:hypothetical protein HNY73_017735 [Argiope bruennichi]
MKILILTTFLFAVFFVPRVHCIQNENNSGNTVDQAQDPNAGKRVNVVDQIQAKAKDVFDAMPAKAAEMLSELDQTFEMMGNAFDKTADMIDPYLKKMDAMKPGFSAKAKDVIAMEGDGRSDDSSSCKSVYSNKTFCNGNSTVASAFVVSIMDHCRDLKNWNRELTSAVNRKCQINKRLDGNCSPSEKAGLLKRLDDLNRLIKCNEEKLKNAKPCMNKGCRTHDGDRNLCAYISTSQERMLRLNYTASTFLDTLQQMKESKLEHTAQYTDDFTILKKIQADIRQIANELDDVTPCSVDNCERHTPDNVRQPLLTENLEHTTEREIAVMDTGNTPEKNNKDEDQPAQMDIESESPFQPVDKRHTAKRKNSVENPDMRCLVKSWKCSVS